MINLHLFFDVFIEDAPLGVYLRGHKERFDNDYKLRTSTPSYRFQTKYDISRYSLASYRDIPWKSATLRIVCQNPEHESIYQEAATWLPNADIQQTRSDTAQKYFDALTQLKAEDDAWIFFCPNNDHPFLGNHDKLAAVLQDADEAVRRLNPEIITIPYSHYTESVNLFSPAQHEWGAYGNVYPKLLYETEHSYIVESDKLLTDSVHIARKKDLLWLFGNSKKGGRVIRQEDTEFYLSSVKRHVLVIPKFEFCRHYDGYMHINDKVAPLFIPEGFFSRNIKIRYGYDRPLEGYVNINPLAEYFSYQAPTGTDMKIVIDDIPLFWKERISEIDINPEFPKDLNRKFLASYMDLDNPWRKSPLLRNYFRNYRRYFRYLMKKRSARV